VRLLFLTGSLSHGGAERHTVTLANRLAERGHECYLAYLKDDAAQLGRLHGAASVQCLHARRYLDFSALKALQRLIGQVNPSVLVAVNQYALLYASLAQRRVPLALTFHATFLCSTKERLQMLAYRPLFWSADCTVFMCEAQRQHWLRRAVFGRRNLVIHNGVDTAQWCLGPPHEAATLRRVLDLGEGDFVIGMAAVLRREKNHVQLVHAVERLRRRGIPARALMIGDGEMRPAVQALARRLGIAEHVSITGLQQDVRPFLGACDVVALPSLTETFSLAALEAMALGRPVVHAEVGGAAEMIRDGSDGLLFPVGDTAALVERLASLAGRQERVRIGEQARRTVEARFSERAMVERYEATFSALANTRSKHGNVRKPAGAH
jgi:glycosyltransferase involved in cell wall biosynthesis